jgi:sigma-B regulation protein RsbU (phosphoserine phosphatase)
MGNEAISQVPLFSSLPERELDYLVKKLDALEVEAGTILLKEGEKDRRYFILVDGEVEVIKALGTPDERSLGVRGKGSILGEMSLFSQDSQHTASVRALTPLRLMEMPHSELDALLRRQPTFAYRVLRVLSRRLEESENITIRDLRRKNRELRQAYDDLKAAQAQIIEKERLERELEVARQIQMGILPCALPVCPEFEFGARVIPMAAVGGDFFDIIRINSDRWGIAVGDVTDHGIPAALLMAMTVTLLRAEARRAESPAEVLRQINRHLLEMDGTGMFVTLLYGELSCESRVFRYARAGHEIPILIQEGGGTLFPEHTVGQPLGLIDDPELDEGAITLPRKALFFLYSDGVTETIDEAGERFGQGHLISTLRGVVHLAAEDVCNHVWQALQTFRGGEVQHDDVTLMTIKVE